MPKRGYHNDNAGRVEMIDDFREYYNEARKKNANVTEEYKKITEMMLDLAVSVKDVNIGAKKSTSWNEKRKLQVEFLKCMEDLLDVMLVDIGKEENEKLLKKENIDQIGKRMARTKASYDATGLSSDNKVDSKFNKLWTVITSAYDRVNTDYQNRVNKDRNRKTQASAMETLNEVLKQDERNMDYPGLSNVQMLLTQPQHDISADKDKMDADMKLIQAQMTVKGKAQALALLVCPLHAVDKETGRTMNLSLADLTKAKQAYDELLESITEYQKILPKDHMYASQLTAAATSFAKERSAIEKAINEINKSIPKNSDLKNNIRPFSIYEVEGRVNPDFDNGFPRKADALMEASRALTEQSALWKQDNKTKTMLNDHNEMMTSFGRLNDKLSQMMKLDQGEKGYLTAMTPGELRELRDHYQDTVIKMEMFIRNYGQNPRTNEQKNLNKALKDIYPGMVSRFMTLDQLVGGEDVANLQEAVNNINAEMKKLAEMQPPKDEGETKGREEQEIRLVTEQDRLKNVGYYQMLLDDGQLYPQMLFDNIESQRSADLASMRRESQEMTGTRKNFEQMMERNRRMRACPDAGLIGETLSVDPEKIKMSDLDREGFNRHYLDFQQQVMDLAAKLTEYYEPDEKGKTKLLNSDEIEELSNAYARLGSTAYFCGSYLPKGDPRAKAFFDLDEVCTKRCQTFTAAKEFIRRNAPENRVDEEEGRQMPKTRAFSLYELQGTFNPEIDNNAIDDLAKMKEQKAAFEMSLNKLSNKDLKLIDPIRGEYRAFERELDNLYNKVIPDLLSMDPDRADFGAPFTREKVQDAIKEFERATMAFIPLRVDYQNRLEGKGPKITQEEKAMYDTAEKLYQRISEKYLAMDYLLEKTGNELMKDVERHNVQVDEFKEELKKYREDQKLSPEQRSKDLKLKHNAKFLAWVGQLDDLYANKKLQPSALFEDDPSVGRSHVMAQLRLTEQNIIDVQMRNFHLGLLKWDESGKRDLGPITEFQTALAMRNQLGSHTVTQYASKGKRSTSDKNLGKEIMELTLKSMPAHLKDQTFMAVVGEEPDSKHPGIKKPIYGPKKVEDAIRDFYNSKLYKGSAKTNQGNVAKQMDDFLSRIPEHELMLEITNDTVHDYERKGFAKAFSKEALESSKELRNFVIELNRNLYNAGVNKETYDVLADNRKPLGYNQGFAKVAAQQLNLDLAQQRAADPNQIIVEDRQDAQGNKPSKHLLPQTELWEQTKFQFGDARPEQQYDVVIASTEKNYDEQVPGDKKKEFYTTTKNFRASSFVGFHPQSVAEVPDYSKMTAKEMLLAEEDLEKFLYEKSNGKASKHDPHTADVNDYRSFQKGEILANLSDLAAMDYILGKPTRTADELRIGFKLDEKGKVKVSNVLGAETEDPLFSTLKPNDPSLTNPDNMLVMTSDMAQKILNWSEGKFTDNDAHVKAALNKLPSECLKAFGDRVNVLAAQIRSSLEHKDEFVDVDNEEGKDYVVGLQTKPGVIRILDRKDFDKLKLDDLAIGRNSGDYRTRDTKKPLNIFDAAADLPKQSHLALMDKHAAVWNGDSKNLTYGHRPESRLFKRDFEKDLHETRFERKFLENERERSLMKLKRMVGDVVRMDMDRKDESFFHFDTGKYTDVLKAQEKLDRALTLYGLNRTTDIADFEKDLIRRKREAIEYNKNQLPKDIEEAEKYNASIEKKRQEAIEYNKKVKDPAKLREVPEYKRIPTAKRIPTELESDTIKLNDPKKLKEVKDAMVELKKKLEIYLTKRENPSSEFGKRRYAAMLKMYQNVNDRLADYITYTGDTSVLPNVAKYEIVPPEDGRPVPKGKEKYKLTIEPMMEPGEWELRIPDFIREDHIKATRNDILNKAGTKPEQIRMAQTEANLVERLIRDRYELAKKYYDLNGKKTLTKTVTKTVVDPITQKATKVTEQQPYTIADEMKDLNMVNARDVDLLKMAKPPKLRPVVIKDSQKKANGPKVSDKMRKEFARGTYEHLLNGGTQQGTFDFTTLSSNPPAPGQAGDGKQMQEINISVKELGVDDLIIKNKADEKVPKKKVQDPFNIINNVADDSFDNSNLINNDDSIIIKNHDDNDIINNKAEDNKINIKNEPENEPKKEDVKEDNKIEDVKEDKKEDVKNNEIKENKNVKEIKVDNLFDELMAEPMGGDAKRRQNAGKQQDPKKQQNPQKQGDPKKQEPLKSMNNHN